MGAGERPVGGHRYNRFGNSRPWAADRQLDDMDDDGSRGQADAQQERISVPSRPDQQQTDENGRRQEQIQGAEPGYRREECVHGKPQVPGR